MHLNLKSKPCPSHLGASRDVKSQPSRDVKRPQLSRDLQKADKSEDKKRNPRAAIKHSKDAREDVQVIIEDRGSKKDTRLELLNKRREQKYEQSLKRDAKKLEKGVKLKGYLSVKEEEEFKDVPITLKPRKFMIEESLDPFWGNEEDEIKFEISVPVPPPVPVSAFTKMTAKSLNAEELKERREAGIQRKKKEKRAESHAADVTKWKESNLNVSRDRKAARKEKSAKNEDWSFGQLSGVQARNIRGDVKKKVRARKISQQVPNVEELPERIYTKNQVLGFREQQRNKRMEKLSRKKELVVKPESDDCVRVRRSFYPRECDCISNFHESCNKLPEVREDPIIVRALYEQDQKEEFFESSIAEYERDDDDFDLDAYFKGNELLREFLNNMPQCETESFMPASIQDAISKAASNKNILKWLRIIVETARVVDALTCNALPDRFKQHILSNFIGSFGVNWFAANATSVLISSVLMLIPKDVPQKNKEELIVTPESISGELDKVGDILEYVFDSAFSDAVKTLMIYGAFSEYFTSYESAMSIYKWCGYPPKNQTMLSIFEQIVKAFANIVRAFEALAAGASLNEAFFLKDPWVANKVKAAELLMQKEHFFAGIEADGKFCRYEWVTEYHKVVRYLKERRESTSTAKPAYMELSRLIVSLDNAHAEVQSHLDGGFRVAPIAVMLGEYPGIGKSQLVDLVAATIVHCYYDGKIIYHPDMVFHRPTSSEFMDGLINQIIYHYSELGKETQAIAKTGQITVDSELTSVVDNQPMIPNMAFADKGKKLVRPLGVIVDTNNMSLNLKEKVIAVAAYERRFVKCKFTVLPQFCKDGSCEIDYLKVKELNKGHPMDIYSIDMWKENAVDCTRTNKIVICQGANIYVWLCALRDLVKSHFDAQNHVKTLRENNNLFDVFGDLGDKVQEPSKAPKVTPIDGITSAIGGFFERMDMYRKAKQPIDVDEAKEFLTSVQLSEFDIGEEKEEFAPAPKSNLPYTHAMLPQLLQKMDRDSPVMKIAGKTFIDEEHFEKRNPKIRDQNSPNTEELAFLMAMNRQEAESKESGTEEKRDQNGNLVASMESGTWKYLTSKRSKVKTKYNAKKKEENKEPDPDIVNFDRNMRQDVKQSIEVRHRIFTLENHDDLLEECFKHVLMSTIIIYVKGERIAKVLIPSCCDTAWKIDVLDQICKRIIKLKYTFQLITAQDLDTSPVQDNCGNYAGELPKTEMPVIDWAIPLHELIWSDLKLLGNFFIGSCAMPVAAGLGVLDEKIQPDVVNVVSYLIFGFLYSFIIWFSAFGLAFPICHLIVKWCWPGKNFLDKFQGKLIRYGITAYQHRKKIIMFAAMAGTCGFVLVTINALRNFWSQRKKEEKRFVYVSPQGALYGTETLTACGPGITRIDTRSVKEQWNEVRTLNKPAYTGDSESLSKIVMENVRYLHIESCDNTVAEGYMTGIFGRYALAPYHYFNYGEEFTITAWSVYDETKTKDHKVIILTKKDLIKVGSDMVMFDTVKYNFRDIRVHLSKHTVLGTNGKGHFNHERVTWRHEKMCTSNNNKKGERYFSTAIYDPYLYEYESKDGMCGLPFIVDVGNGAVIAGLHVAGVTLDGRKFGVSYPINLDNINIAFEVYKAGSEDRILFEGLSEPEVDTLSAPEPLPMSVLTLPHPKSPFSHEPFDNIEYHGAIPGIVNINNKSNLAKSIFADEKDFLEEFIEAFEKAPSSLFGRPMMKPTMVDGKYINPISLNLRKLSVKKQAISRELMVKVINLMVEHIDNKLCFAIPAEGLSPWTLDVALNGCVTDDFFGAIRWTTAAGFGYKGTKGEWTILDDKTKKRSLLPEVENHIVRIVKQLMDGYYVRFVHTASLKDEPRLLEKCANGKTRVFFVTPLTMLVLSRMYLSPILSFMVSHCQAFGAAIGINMHKDSMHLFREMTEFSNLHMTGDYSGYDVSMPPEISMIAYTVLSRMLQKYGYNEEAMKMVNGLLSEFYNLTISYNGDVLSAQGITASGQSSTAELNSLKAMALIYCGWYSHKDLCDKDIRQFVRIKTFGDDLWAAVKTSVSELFNNVYYATFISEMGLEYTNADKGHVEENFCDEVQVSFLKRQFREHPEMKCIVGQLDYNSLYKMLYWTMPSSIATEADQMKMTCDSFLREAFFHLGRERYARLRKYVMRVYELKFDLPNKVEETHFHTYDKLIEFYGQRFIDMNLTGHDGTDC